jgi:hypothetical protein
MHVTRRSTGLVLLLVLWLLPAAALSLWLGSGRENLTKTMVVVTKTVDDPLWGETTEQKEVPGPVFGYYVGLDAVIGAAVIAVVGSGVVLWVTIRRKAAGKIERTET